MPYKKAVSTRPLQIFYDFYEQAITHWWLPAGLFIFLSGFFWAPNQHNYKVIINFATLLPALLSVFSFRDWRRWFFSSPVIPLLVLYLGYMIAMSALRGADTPAFIHWSFYILLFLFGVSARMAIATTALTRILAAAAIVAALGGIYAIIADMHRGAIWDSEYRLIGYGTLYNALKSGHLFGVFVVIATWAGFVDKSWRWPNWLAAITCMIAVLLTGSRAPCIALFTVNILAIIGNQHGRRRLLSLLQTTMIASFITFFFWRKLSERGMSLRPEVWKHALLRSLEQPVLGAGLGTELAIPMSVGGTLYDTHNIFLAVFFYGGFVGLSLFIVAFGASFLSAWMQRDKSPLFLLAALLQLYGLTTLQFDGGSLIGRPTVYWALFWLPMALNLYARFRQTQPAASLGT